MNSYEFIQKEKNAIYTLDERKYREGEFPCDRSVPPKVEVPIQIVSVVLIPNDDDSLAEAVFEAGMVSCAVDATGTFLAYKGGIYSDPSCSNSVPNHAIKLVTTLIH